MVSQTVSKLSRVFFEKSFKGFAPQIFNKTCSVVYEGQVPNVALVLITGSVLLGVHKIEATSDELFLIGYEELMTNKAFKDEVKVFEGSQVIILDRETAVHLKSVNEFKT
jgi:hypothetical protein